MLSVEQIGACGVEWQEASEIAAVVNRCLAAYPAPRCWAEFSQQLLTPTHPFPLHLLIYETVYAEHNAATEGPPPAWFPTADDIAAANITELMRQVGVDTYPEFHAWTVQNRDTFWHKMLDRLRIQAVSTGTETRRDATGIATNLREINIVESCFTAASDAIAVVTQREGDETLTGFTYRELESLTNRVANGVVDIGLKPGDAAAIVMPMTFEAVAIYLGIIKAGCVVIGIADSFAPDEIAIRLRIGNARAVFTQSVLHRSGKQFPLYEKICTANAPRAIVSEAEAQHADTAPLKQTRREGDMSWEDFLSDSDTFSALRCHPDAPTNVLFSSGTTGAPKAIPWTHTTSIKAAADAHLHHDIHPGDVLAWPTSLGWMMGPWLVYASLINRATLALYPGVPTDREFGRFVQHANVSMLGVVPTLVRAWKNSGCMSGLDWQAIRAFSSTGECSNPMEMLYLMSLAGYKPVIEYCGGTEIGGGYVTGTRVQPAAPSVFTTPALGLDFRLFDARGEPADNGEVFIVPPSLGLSTRLLNADHDAVYFAGTPGPNLRRHGDAMERLPDTVSTDGVRYGARYRAHGRVDDTMNLSGIKASAAEIESVLNTLAGVQETAAVAVPPKTGGPSRLVVYTVLTPDAPERTPQQLHEALQRRLSERLNPLFRIHAVVIKETLPRTASQKVMRRLLRDEAQDT